MATDPNFEAAKRIRAAIPKFNPHRGYVSPAFRIEQLPPLPDICAVQSYCHQRFCQAKVCHNLSDFDQASICWFTDTGSQRQDLPLADGLDTERAMFAQLGGVAGLSRASRQQRAGAPHSISVDAAGSSVQSQQSSGPASAASTASNTDLLTTMAARLRTLEAAQRNMR